MDCHTVSIDCDDDNCKVLSVPWCTSLCYWLFFLAFFIRSLSFSPPPNSWLLLGHFISHIPINYRTGRLNITKTDGKERPLRKLPQLAAQTLHSHFWSSIALTMLLLIILYGAPCRCFKSISELFPLLFSLLGANYSNSANVILLRAPVT